MKYLITESQVESLLNVFNHFINSENYEGVCNVLVDYDEEMDRFVLNVFFNRHYIINLGSKQNSFINNSINEIGYKFFDFIGKKPLMYSHYNDC